RACIGDTRSFVASRTQEDDLCQRHRGVIPPVVHFVYQIAIVAPCIGKRVLITRVVSIESQAGRLPSEVGANKGLIAFTMSTALNFVRHKRSAFRSISLPCMCL